MTTVWGMAKLDGWRQVARLWSGECFVGEEGDFIFYPVCDWEPVEFSKNWRDVAKFVGAGNESSEWILDQLKLVNVFVSGAVKVGVRIVEFCTDDAACNCP